MADTVGGFYSAANKLSELTGVREDTGIEDAEILIKFIRTLVIREVAGRWELEGVGL